MEKEKERIVKKLLKVNVDKAFGLDISDRSVEIIELHRLFNFSVKTYGRIDLSPGIVRDGIIIDEQTLLKEVLKMMKKLRPRRLSTNKVVLSLPENRVFSHSFIIDSKLKSTDDIRNAVIIEVSKILPISISKILWDFEIKELPNSKRQIIFIGVEKDVVDQYIRFCNSLGLEVVNMSSESMNLARVILKKSEKQSLILDMGTKVTNISIFDSNDRLSLSVSIPLGGEDFTTRISQKLEIDRDKAESEKIKWGILKNEKNMIKPIIEPVVIDVITELKKAINYYEYSFGQNIDAIYLVGGSSMLSGFLERVSFETKKHTEIASTENIIKFNSISEKDSSSLYANVLGLGMLGVSTQFDEVNLFKRLPRSESNSVNKLNLFKYGYLSKITVLRILFNNRLTLVLILFVLALIFILFSKQVYDYKNSGGFDYSGFMSSLRTLF